MPAKYRVGKTSGSRRTNFLEGPSFDKAGNLFCVDIRLSRIYRITPAGDWDMVSEYEGEPNGLKIDRAGKIFVADRKLGIINVDEATGAVAPVVSEYQGKRFKGVNDLIFAANGDLYFTDQGKTGLHDPTGCVYRYRTSGELEVVLGNIPSPNGLVFNRRENELFVAVTRANAVWRIPMDERGVANKVGLFTQLFSAGPDGLALDEDGNVAVTHPGLGLVWLFSKRGEPLYTIQSNGGNMTTNIAYGGADNKSLFIVDSAEANILVAKMPVAGKPMYSHT